MKVVFVDTVGLIALLDEDDQWHAAAEPAWEKVLHANTQIVSTTFVLAECGNAAARRPYRNHVGMLRAKFEESESLILPTEEDWAHAWQDYMDENAGDASIVDHISFVVMRRLGITDAFTNDWHFKMAGFNVLF